MTSLQTHSRQGQPTEEARTPLAFKDIEIADKEAITAYTLTGQRRNCDLSFSNLCCWRFLYGTQYAEYEGWLLLKFRVEGRLAYMMPVGKGDLKQAVEALADDARREGEPLQIMGVCHDLCAELEACMPGRFRFEADRDYADYLYLRTDLATLEGKKLQAKRNHVNRFRRTYPDYEYLPITPQLVQECLEVEERWCRENNCDEQAGTGNERRALEYALRHFEELGLTGGLLRTGGQTVAFSFGMPICEDTFGVHVEKADTCIEGSYAMINMEFARRVPSQYIYLNREEDLGIPGLRKAKLSYQPAVVLEKYTAYDKE